VEKKAPSFLSLSLSLKAFEENGSVQFVRGSHKHGFYQHGKSDEDGNLLFIKQNIRLTREQEEDIFVSHLQPGEFSLHDGMEIHGSPVNVSDKRRLGFTCQFITPDVVFDAMDYGDDWTESDFRNPVLVSGVDDVGNLKYAKTRGQMMEEACM